MATRTRFAAVLWALGGVLVLQADQALALEKIKLAQNLSPISGVSIVAKQKGFFEKYGNKTIILARFVPIVRTFAPFVAGVGEMNYSKFISFNVIGGITWVALFTFGGYFFGGLKFVQDNFSFVVIAIILISVMPGVIEFLRERSRKEPVPAE